MPAAPPVPEPDRKDWTWAVRERCPACGFDPASVEQHGVPDLARRYAATLADALLGPAASERPAPAVWSPLEYGCHVRDVCVLFDERLRLMLTQDDPQFANWHQDETALAQRYWTQAPTAVAAEVGAAVERIAGSFGNVAGGQWARTGRRSDGSEFTVDSFARYFLHDLAHHAWDVGGDSGRHLA